MLQPNTMSSPTPTVLNFGKFLELQRVSHGLKQVDIYRRLGWKADRYGRIENGDRPPLFEDIPPIKKAMEDAGISFTLQTLHQFVTLAQKRNAEQQTYKDSHSAEEWAALFQKLALEDHLLPAHLVRPVRPSPPQILETAHLIHRDTCYGQVLDLLQEHRQKKLVVVRGTPGVGKSSVLSWMTAYLSRRAKPPVQVIGSNFRSIESIDGSKTALRFFLGTLLMELGCYAPPTETSLDAWTTLLLDRLEHLSTRLIITLDHGECLLEQGQLSTCWERFFSRFLRSAHRATLVLAIRQWPEWYSGESIFVSEVTVPPLSMGESLQLLHQLGLSTVPISVLSALAERIGGIPIGLEWAGALIRRPLPSDEWMEVFAPTPETFFMEQEQTHDVTEAVTRLLAEPHLFTGAYADNIAPFLARIMETQQLSLEAQRLLDVLSISAIPLAQPALVVICQSAGTRPLKELRRASLLVSYEYRVHVNAVVAAAALRQLEPGARAARERLLIDAYRAWLRSGQCSGREAGTIIYELSRLLLGHHQLLDAAEILVQYGWLAFNLGHAPSISRYAYGIIQKQGWDQTTANVCGHIILEHYLAPFLGNARETERCEWEYHQALTSIRSETPPGRPSLESHVLLQLISNAANATQFEEAQTLLQQSVERLAPFFSQDADLHASLLERQAFLLGKWSDWEKGYNNYEAAQQLFDQTLLLYEQCRDILSRHDERLSPLEDSIRKKRLARVLNNLGYRLNLIGQSDRALEVIEQSITLKEQGFSEYGALASSYGEKAQALANLGRYREALHFSDKAREEVQRLARAGDRSAQEEQWVYQVERAKILWQLAQADEAERLAREASPNIHERRKPFRMIADQIVGDIRRWRQMSQTATCQVDWRWIDALRDLVSQPVYDWWKLAGPLLPDEELEMEALQGQAAEAEAEQRRYAIMAASLKRELDAALKEQRNPSLRYLALPADVRRDRDALPALDQAMQTQEPNILVRDCYHEVIEEQIMILSLVEATARGDDQRFRELMHQLYPPPTVEEETKALSWVRRVLLQGILKDETKELALEVACLLADQQIDFDFTMSSEERAAVAAEHSLAPPDQRTQRMVRVQVAKHFLEMMFERRGWARWQVVIDPSAQHSYADSASRRLVLLPGKHTVQQVLRWYEHEAKDHIASAVAGDLSRFGLLGIGLTGYPPYREGCALYRERQAAEASGEPFDESSIWMGTFSIVLANRIGNKPNAFYRLFTCLERFILLYRLLKRPDQRKELAEEKAREFALSRCLRLVRGTPHPNNEHGGWDLSECWTKDIIYQRGLDLIEQEVAKNPFVLNYLSLGKLTPKHIPLLQEMHVLPTALPLEETLSDERELEDLLFSLEDTTPEDVV